jgi:hypothetical protein
MDGLLAPAPVAVQIPGEPAGPPAPAAPSPAAVSVDPADGRLRVALEGFAQSTSVRVGLTDAAEARVWVAGDGAGARFVVGPGEVRVLARNGGDVRVELPRSAEVATVEVDGQVAVLVAGGRLQLQRPAADSLREDVVFRIGE